MVSEIKGAVNKCHNKSYVTQSAGGVGSHDSAHSQSGRVICHVIYRACHVMLLRRTLKMVHNSCHGNCYHVKHVAVCAIVVEQWAACVEKIKESNELRRKSRKKFKNISK